MTHLATSTVTWFPAHGHMHFVRMSQYMRNQSLQRNLIRSDAVGEIHGAQLVRMKQRSLPSRSCIQTLCPTQQMNTIHSSLWRHYTFSFALVHSQLISSELSLDTSGLASMDIYVFAQHQPFSSSFTYIRNKISDMTSAYAQHYGITSTGLRQKSICHKTRRNQPSIRQ